MVTCSLVGIASSIHSCRNIDTHESPSIFSFSSDVSSRPASMASTEILESRRDFLSYLLTLMRRWHREHGGTLPAIDVAALEHLAWCLDGVMYLLQVRVYVCGCVGVCVTAALSLPSTPSPSPPASQWTQKRVTCPSPQSRVTHPSPQRRVTHPSLIQRPEHSSDAPAQ